MIRHIVLIRFREGTSQFEINGLFAALRGLKSIIPGMLTITAGANMSAEGQAQGYTHGFTVEFDTVAARNAYLVHPEHVLVGHTLVAAAEGGVDGILVLDYEAGDDPA